MPGIATDFRRLHLRRQSPIMPRIRHRHRHLRPTPAAVDLDHMSVSDLAARNKPEELLDQARKRMATQPQESMLLLEVAGDDDHFGPALTTLARGRTIRALPRQGGIPADPRQAARYYRRRHRQRGRQRNRRPGGVAPDAASAQGCRRPHRQTHRAGFLAMKRRLLLGMPLLPATFWRPRTALAQPEPRRPLLMEGKTSLYQRRDRRDPAPP